MRKTIAAISIMIVSVLGIVTLAHTSGRTVTRPYDILHITTFEGESCATGLPVFAALHFARENGSISQPPTALCGFLSAPLQIPSDAARLIVNMTAISPGGCTNGTSGSVSVVFE